MKHALAALLALTTSLPAVSSEYQPGYSRSQVCTRSEYREEYIPGTKNSPGFVKNWEEIIEVPCKDTIHSMNKGNGVLPHTPDTNDCSEGSLIGGILGAGLATSSSRGKDRWWAIPAGAFGGAMIGCQVDGG